MSNTLAVADIHTLGQKQASEIIERIARIERRTFPSCEAFDFNADLWKKKANTRVIYATRSAILIAYAVYVRTKGMALLHKVCVAEPYRHQGIGKILMAHTEQRLRREGCRSVQLWVDKDREHARRLYVGRGFEERGQVDDYYGPGRTGIRMVLDLDGR
jgi:ribosomal protein S18 acetylase RimI-like enzyme